MLLIDSDFARYDDHCAEDNYCQENKGDEHTNTARVEPHITKVDDRAQNNKAGDDSHPFDGWTKGKEVSGLHSRDIIKK